jgi:squalene-hopene cyclase-like protein/prenyltransferase/squalene oxidase-like repeat protein
MTEQLAPHIPHPRSPIQPWPVAARYDVIGESRRLVASLVEQPWGQVSPSIYETGRLVSLAPWLAGHTARLRFLLGTQREDGGWGGPHAYALVPTLSATEALVAAHRVPRALAAAVAAAAEAGLRALHRSLRRIRRDTLPDMPAIEIIVPALIAALNQRLRASAPGGPGAAPLPLPVGVGHGALAAIRGAVSVGDPIPDKLMHAIEIVGDVARGSASIRPAGSGIVGASPAATAAWQGQPATIALPGAGDYLADLVRRTGGPVPCCTPITVFERAWVIGALARTGLRPRLPRTLLASLAAALGERGTPGGEGLPDDADTTAGTLFALSERGRPTDVDCLLPYELERYFCTWPGEQGVSTTVNAHVLEALGSHRTRHPHPARTMDASVAKVARWLLEQQQPDGSWYDRWHASPFYATATTSLALDRYAGRRGTRATQAAVTWILDQQRGDGSWGVWGPTTEETAYAVQALLGMKGPRTDAMVRAAARGYLYLRRSIDRGDGPALWHDKDLYRPDAIIRAVLLGALHLAQLDAQVMATADRLRRTAGHDTRRLTAFVR